MIFAVTVIFLPGLCCKAYFEHIDNFLNVQEMIFEHIRNVFVFSQYPLIPSFDKIVSEILQ